MYCLQRAFKTSLKNLNCHGLLSVTRLNSSQPPQFKTTGSRLVNYINYVNDVDKYQSAVSTSSTNQDLASQLTNAISSKPQLLALLLLFHSELSSLGIAPNCSREFSFSAIWKYRWAYLTKLKPLHTEFWEQCQFLDISQRDHRMGWLPNNIGVLDPSNFDLDVYNQLQLGILDGVDFRDIQPAWASRTFKPQSLPNLNDLKPQSVTSKLE